MAQYIFTESQLKKIEETLTQGEVKESKDGNYMAKQQLFIIATLAYKMWEEMGEDEELEDWMGTKIAQAENFIRSATAPEMSAGVMAANIPKKAMVARVVPSPARAISPNMKASRFPKKSFSKGTCASEYPMTTHKMGTMRTQ